VIKKIVWITFFAIAMAYMESAVVVYLRAIYYPGGFIFPITLASTQHSLIEIGREAATIVMLYSVAALAFSKGINRFSAFMLAFGVWDIFYYVWLYVFIKWPESLLTWDILFLIPLPWIGPVLAPALVSISLIAASVIILIMDGRSIKFQPSRLDWIGVIAAGIIIITSFIWDYKIVLNGTVPGKFNWAMFFTGEILGIIVYIRVFLKSLRLKKPIKI
jgi:hypothetical protein